MRNGITRAIRPWLPVLLLVVLLLGLVALIRSSGAPAAAPTASPTPTPPAAGDDAGGPQRTAVFIGDSLTAGVGLERGAARWSSLVSASRDWRELNLGRTGTGYLARPGTLVCGYSRCPDFPTMAARAVTEHADVVVVTGGQNDTILAYQDPEREQAAIAATFRTLRAGLPDAVIVAVGPAPIWGITAPLRDIEDAVRSAAASNGALFVSLTTPAADLESSLLPDGLHLDETGHALVAARVAAALDCADTTAPAWCAAGGPVPTEKAGDGVPGSPPTRPEP